MSNRTPPKKTIGLPLPAIGIALLLLLAAVFLWIGDRNSIQAEGPMAASVRFEGEYRIGDGEWLPIQPGKHIPATKGDVTLRGIFVLFDAETEEPLSPLLPGIPVSLYLNHLHAIIQRPDGTTLQSDAEHPLLGEDACAAMWSSYTSQTPDADPSLPATPEILTILLQNPHRYGNETAVDELLQNLSVSSGINFEKAMLQQGALERNSGLLILITALIILGVAVCSSILHIRYGKELWLIGLAFCSAGGYLMFHAFAVSLWNESNIVNTRALGLCMMLYLLFVSLLIVTQLRGLPAKIAALTSLALAVSLLLCVSLSFLPSVRFYDTWGYWTLLATLCVLTLIACLLLGLRQANRMTRLLFLIAYLVLLAFLIDALATRLGWWAGGRASTCVFLAVFLFTFITLLPVIPSQIQAAIKARQLEAEQQALKLELQESRISIMLSQMQPHFIFNTLNTIYHLCEIDPDVARSTISSFSEYLRNNIDNLGQSEMIPFEKELSFVKTYLDIEKVRFDDELSITFDIRATNFKLPVLTVQPLVENAVKHGTSKKEGGAELILSSRETDTCYEIIISDTGIGFEPGDYNSDGHRHIGINNVSQRLQNLCDGTLSVQSTPGVGTTVTVTIPKKEASLS